MKLLSVWRSLQERNVFGANAALTAATNLALGALGIVTGVLAARLLGPHGRGELAAIQTYALIYGHLSMLGTDQSVVYYSASDPQRAGRYITCAVLISLIVGVPLISGGYAAMPRLLSAQSPQVVNAARWYLLSVPIFVLQSLWLIALRGRSAFAPWNALRTTPALAWLLTLAFAWLEGFKDPRWVAATYLVSLATLLIPIELVVKRYIPVRFAPDTRQFRPMLSYGLPCFASGLPLTFNLRLAQTLIAGLLPPSALGLYVAACAWSSAINFLINGVGAVLFPTLAAHEFEQDRFRIFSRGSRLAAMLVLITTPLLAAATPWGLVWFFGEAFRPAIVPALILVPAGAVLALNGVLEEGFRGLGMPATVLYAELVGSVTTATSLYLLLSPMGIVGAAIASLLGYSTVTIALLLQVRWLTGESPAALLVPRTEEITEGMTGLATLITNFLS
jgi:O-antigen/teichoic acid export membrane protein